MKRQVIVSTIARANLSSRSREPSARALPNDILCKRLALVNVVFIGAPGAQDREWVLIDAGLRGTARMIRRIAAQRFRRDSRPAAIIVTHGHFDHVGALIALAEEWQTPVFAHELELRFLNGTSSYPPPDPGVGGILARLSPFYHRGPVDVTPWLRTIPESEVPGMPGWQWLWTPGHSPGHISLWRESDRTLLAGDAFITTNQESAYAVAIQRPEIHGPPQYFTPDWDQAEDSVQKLAALEPELAITGHGPPLRGAELRGALKLLAHDFQRIAVPRHGRYAATSLVE